MATDSLSSQLAANDKCVDEQDTVPRDTGQRIARNVPRTQDTVPREVASNLHRTQGCQTIVRQTTFQPRDQGSRMLTNVTQFLEQASEIKNKEAEEKLKWEQICNSPGPGFQRGQLIPANVPFCLLCRAYKKKIHFCSALDKYVNIDDRNLIMLEGDTAAAVEGLVCNTGKCTMFETRKIMKYYLVSRIKGVYKVQS